MAMTCRFEELDPETREYLHDVRGRKGRGAPGVFLARGNPGPLWAILVGPLVGMAFLTWGFSSGKGPVAVALLQTAGALIGGWSVLYALRRWLAGRSRKYGGVFTYFDPLNAYEVNGELVRVVRLKTVEGVEAVPGGNGPSRVEFDLGADRLEAVPVPTLAQAQFVEDYYSSMEQLEQNADLGWADATVAEVGAASVAFAEEGRPPRPGTSTDLDFETVPESPAREGKAGFGWPGILVILGSAVGLLVLFSAVNVPVGDDLAFDRARAAGAPGLRGYLLDEGRNTRHREDAKALLARCYDPAVSRLKTNAKGNAPAVRDGVLKLVDSLRTAETAVVSFDAVQLKPDETPADQQGVADRLRTEVADGVARSIGPDLIAFVKPPEGQKAHLTVKFLPVQTGTQVTAVKLWAEVRTEPAAEPVGAGTWTVSGVDLPVGSSALVDKLKVELCRELVGEYKAAPPPDFGGGDF